MGESLWKRWLNEEFKHISPILIAIGFHNFLNAFEVWLEQNNYIKK